LKSRGSFIVPVGWWAIRKFARPRSPDQPDRPEISGLKRSRPRHRGYQATFHSGEGACLFTRHCVQLPREGSHSKCAKAAANPASLVYFAPQRPAHPPQPRKEAHPKSITCSKIYRINSLRSECRNQVVNITSNFRSFFAAFVSILEAKQGLTMRIRTHTFRCVPSSGAAAARGAERTSVEHPPILPELPWTEPRRPS